jgi:AcrR family transcriptional regulator
VHPRVDARDGVKVDQRRTDTREQIKAVALELFADRGYEGTSLREVADRLRITKAAVYYHFRTKEDILASLIEDSLADMDALVRWGRDQPPEPATRVEILRRYSHQLSGRTAELARFMQQAPAIIHEMAHGMKVQTHIAGLIDLLTAPGDPVASRLRARIALATLLIGAQDDPDLPSDHAGRRRAALAIATEVLTPPSATPAASHDSDEATDERD